MRCTSLKMRKRCTNGQGRLVYCTGCKPMGLLSYAVREARGKKVLR